MTNDFINETSNYSLHLKVKDTRSAPEIANYTYETGWLDCNKSLILFSDLSVDGCSCLINKTLEDRVCNILPCDSNAEFYLRLGFVGTAGIEFANLSI